jgi:hypothetical protein
MRELTFHQKQKILANKTNFKAFGKTLARKVFENRCNHFNKKMTEKMLKYIDVIADYHTETYWQTFGEYTDQNFNLFLSIFNFNEEWDIVGSDSRIHPGVEELLNYIEPKEIFERLHGKENLKAFYEIHEIIGNEKRKDYKLSPMRIV